MNKLYKLESVQDDTFRWVDLSSIIAIDSYGDSKNQEVTYWTNSGCCGLHLAHATPDIDTETHDNCKETINNFISAWIEYKGTEEYQRQLKDAETLTSKVEPGAFLKRGMLQSPNSITGGLKASE